MTTTETFKIGDRVDWDGARCDVEKVGKTSGTVKVSYWAVVMGRGIAPVLVKEWVPAHWLRRA